MPPDLTAAGAWTFELTGLELSAPATPLAVPPGASRLVEFLPTPPLRVHVLAVRFRPAGGAAKETPRPLDLALLQSWLGRA